jgi:opacity protein-like surface antigen
MHCCAVREGRGLRAARVPRDRVETTKQTSTDYRTVVTAHEPSPMLGLLPIKSQERTLMKKRLVYAVTVAGIFGAVPAAHAQQKSELTYGVSGGLTLPIGSIGDVNGTGINLQGHATYAPSSLAFKLRGDAGFWTLGGKSVNRSGVNFSTKSVRFINVTANAMYEFEGAKDATTVPYVIGGVGIYNGSQGAGTNFGFNAGGGVTFRLSGFDAFAEARFHNILANGGSARVIPLSFGINFKP